jgi:hypothetical protein
MYLCDNLTQTICCPIYPIICRFLFHGCTCTQHCKREILFDAMHRTKIRLLEDFDDNGFIYER